MENTGNICSCGNKKYARANTCWDCHKLKLQNKKEELGPYRKRLEVKLRRNTISKEWNKKNIESVLLSHAKRRAKELNLPFSLTKEDILVPEICPVLGIKLVKTNKKLEDNSPTLDRIIPELGYVKGNIQVISFRANRIKNNAHPSELEKVFKHTQISYLNAQTNVLKESTSNHNNGVILLGTYGNDELHARSAWCSTSSIITEDKQKRIPELLKMLAENKHETPFEKSMLHFLVVCDTASHIHLIKHRIGVSVNAESARYKELKDDKYYIPDDWPEHIKTWTKNTVASLYVEYHDLIEELVANGFDRKRAKESARFVLPYANQLTLDVSFNWRSFAHFLSLRRTKHAQKEIRDIANKMLSLVEQTHKFDLTIDAFRSANLLGDDDV